MAGMLAESIAEGRVATVHLWGEGRVLKLARDWVPAEWVESEFSVGRALFEAGIDMPEPIELLTVEGRRAIVYDRVVGETMLEALDRRKLRYRHYGSLLGRLHASIHAVCAPANLPDALGRLRTRIGALEIAPPALRVAALEALDRLPPGSAVLHGDFHPGNVMITYCGAVVIDWPDASRGHPLADVARTVVLATIGGLPRGAAGRSLQIVSRRALLSRYLKGYSMAAELDRSALREWILPVLIARLSEEIESEYEDTIRWATALTRGRTYG